MKILVAICTFIPTNDQAIIETVRETILSIKKQQTSSSDEIKICLLDDGSYYLTEEINLDTPGYHRYLETEKICNVFDIPKNSIDYFYYQFNPLDKREYGKSKLLRMSSLELNNENFDAIIVLDDDHSFQSNDSIAKFIKHLQNGYHFIAARLENPNGTFRSLLDNTVQGTSFCIEWNLYKQIDFFSEGPASWGAGEDSEIFYKVYREITSKPKYKALYDGTIVTKDKLSGRWIPKFSKTGKEKNFSELFFKQYNVLPHSNGSRFKTTWLESNTRDQIPEIFYFFMNKNEIDRLNNENINKELLEIKKIYAIYKYFFKGNKVKVYISNCIYNFMKKSLNLYYRFKNL